MTTVHTLPRLTGNELLAVLRRHSFDVVRSGRKGPRFVQHLDGRCALIPVHGDERLGPGVLLKILGALAISPGELAQML